jgi:hypothetical protein
MNSKRLYFILLACVMLLVAGLIGGAYGADKLLSKQSQKLYDARFKSQTLEVQQTQLIRAEKEIAKYRNLGKIARTIVPQDKDQAQTTREIVKIAQEAGIRLGSVTFPASTLGAQLPAPAPAPAAGAEGAAPKPAAPAAVPLSQLKPVPAITGLYTLEISIQSPESENVPYESFIKFLAGLENNRRTALVTGIGITPSPQDQSKISFTLTINEYIKP